MSRAILEDLISLQEKLLQSGFDDVDIELLKSISDNLNKLVDKLCSDELLRAIVDEGVSLVEEKTLSLTEDSYESLNKFKKLSRALKYKLTSKSLVEDNSECVYSLDIPSYLPETRLALDIGGTLVKLAYLVEDRGSLDHLNDLYEGFNNTFDVLKYFSNELSGFNIDYNVKVPEVYEHLLLRRLEIKLCDRYTLHFKHVPVERCNELFEFLKGMSTIHVILCCHVITSCRPYTTNIFIPIEDRVLLKSKFIHVTGGGSYKFQSELSKLPREVKNIDEMECLVNGLKLVHKLPNSTLVYDFKHNLTHYCSLVSSDASFERVTGTSLGGGTAYGLANYLLDNETSFNENSLGPMDGTEAEIFNVLSINIGKLSHMVGKVYSVKSVFLTGKYLCASTIDGIARGFNESSQLYSDVSMDLYIPHHCGYVSTLGCLLSS